MNWKRLASPPSTLAATKVTKKSMNGREVLNASQHTKIGSAGVREEQYNTKPISAACRNTVAFKPANMRNQQEHQHAGCCE